MPLSQSHNEPLALWPCRAQEEWPGWWSVNEHSGLPAWRAQLDPGPGPLAWSVHPQQQKAILCGIGSAAPHDITELG